MKLHLIFFFVIQFMRPKLAKRAALDISHPHFVYPLNVLFWVGHHRPWSGCCNARACFGHSAYCRHSVHLHLHLQVTSAGLDDRDVSLWFARAGAKGLDGLDHIWLDALLQHAARHPKTHAAHTTFKHFCGRAPSLRNTGRNPMLCVA